MTSLKQHFLRKINQIDADYWGDRLAPIVRLSLDVKEDESSGFIDGSIEVWTPRRNGELILLLTVSLCGVSTIDSVDDCLAEAISKALAQHTSWWKH